MKKITRINAPYTTKTGVQIGLRYTRPMPSFSRDEERIQAALLGIKGTWIPPLWVVLAVVGLAYILVSCMGRYA